MNSFLLHRRFEAKADAKVMQKTIPAKFFRDYFSKNSKDFAFLDGFYGNLPQEWLKKGLKEQKTVQESL